MSDKLILKSINELLGEGFYIPHYQRGYRWTEKQVKDLLDDIWAFATKPNKDIGFYCLQPIVVKRRTWIENGQEITGWEVVDGQQRLSTIYIILYYLAKDYLKVDSLVEEYGKNLYTLRYETRPKSADFLKNITTDKSNIDFYYISEAYQTIRNWFSNGSNTRDRTDKNRFLDTLLGKKEDERSIQVIWYHVEQEMDSVELFTRLNIGKIPLTNAELIKALFLSSSSFSNKTPEEAGRKKLEIAQIWNEIEQRLGDADFWAFITNEQQANYPTKIELLFDMIARREKDQKDPLYTFLNFQKRLKNNSDELWRLWLSIEQYYLTLCEWFKDKNYYHKIGYLVAVGYQISELIELSMQEKKTAFESIMDRQIKNSIKVDIDELNYGIKSHYPHIEALLLLFNVESIRRNENISEYYPFQHHKKASWSLEHIHAQNSESLDKTKKDSWLNWLDYHQQLIEELLDEGRAKENRLLDEIMSELGSIDREKLTWDKFNQLSRTIIDAFSHETEDQNDEIHNISNLALLSQPDNAALNNSVFEVKRREIIKMDREGKYIPICTRRVFLKYYNEKSSTQQYYFWSKEDRNNYLIEIKTILAKYLPQENETLN